MPQLDQVFSAKVVETLAIAASTEALWLVAPPASEVRQQLKVRQLEALYESVYLRIFCAWEAFLEDVLLRLMAGYVTSSYQPVPAPGTSIQKTIKEAKTILYDSQSYLLWHDPGKVAQRAARYLVDSPLELVVRAEKPRLNIFSTIRHQIAHDSADTKLQFRAASTLLASSTFSDNAGKLLRSPDMSDPLNQPKWIRVISFELINVASSILSLSA